MSETIDEKVKLYKRYFARCHEGEEISEFVSEVVLSTIICEHKKTLSNCEHVQKIYMAMLHDCLCLCREVMFSWLKEQGKYEGLCECGKDAFAP
ncbi:hypothetical protein MarSH_116 [Marseillevirus Shanghai 1]|nr:hypothetical protein MarSH_116 [Marseillevirus Shanghai 1]